jgi:hypothetical protein
MFQFTALLLLSLTAATASAVDLTKCVTIKVYNSNDKCQGTPVETLSFSTYSELDDSPCISNHRRMPNLSINHQYCTDTYYHQTVYWGSEECNSDDSKATEEEVMNAGECLHRTKQFISCSDGPCASDDVEDDAMDRFRAYAE